MGQVGGSLRSLWYLFWGGKLGDSHIYTFGFLGHVMGDERKVIGARIIQLVAHWSLVVLT